VGGSWEARVVGGEVTDQLVRGGSPCHACAGAPAARGGDGQPGSVLPQHPQALLLGGRRQRRGQLSEDANSRLGAYDNVLRGYPVGEFVGYGAQLVGHIEARTMALKLAFLRLGGLLFFDAGHAAADAGSLTLYSDVGFGLRLLIPQLNIYSLRADWAFPLRPVPGMPRVGPAA